MGGTSRILAAWALTLPGCALAQVTPGIETPVAAGPTPTLIVPGAAAPVVGPVEGPAGPPAYRPALPDGTPAEEALRDPAKPVTSLVEALQRAYWTNPQLLSERASTRSIDFRLPEARGEYGPQLQYSASYNYRHDIFQQRLPPAVTRSGWTTAASAILTQPLFTFGRLRANEDTARAQIAFQRGSLAATEQDTLLRAVNAYMSVLRDRAGVGIARSQVDLLAREYEDTGTRLKARDATSSDFQQVQSRLELARAQLAAARADAAASDSLFLNMVGAPAGELQAPNPLAIPVQSLEDAYVYAEAHNPVLATAYARERVSRAQLQLAKAALLPRVDLKGEADLNTLSPYSDSLHEESLLGAVTVSGSIDSGQRAARIGEAAAANDSDWRLIDAALRQNREELADAWNGWKSQTAAVARLQIGVQAAELAFLGGQQQEKAGLRTTTEVLDLARDLLTVRSSLNTAMAAAFVSQARILAAMGVLTHARLLPDSASYDPTDHFDQVAHKADVPGLTPLVRALDSALSGPFADRPIRDPAAPLATGEPSVPAP